MSSANCAKCLRPQSEFANPLKQCSRCRRTRYCSVECQRADWPQHKQACVSANVNANTNTRPRATCRLQMMDSQFPKNEAIFFIKKELPHLNDISLAGPFYPRRAIVEQIQSYLHTTSTTGMSLINEISDDEDRLNLLLHINAPQDADPTKSILIEVIEQHNPTMARRLPGPAYNVISAEPVSPMQTRRQTTPGTGNSFESPKVKSMEIHGCFAQKSEAVAEAQEVVEKAKKEFKSSRCIGLPESEHTFESAIIGIGRDNQQKVVTVEVRYDTGMTRQS